MSERLVVNASPLIFLGIAGRLELLRHLGAVEVIVPIPVFEEVTAGGHEDPAAQRVLEAEWLVRVPGAPVLPSVAAWDLGDGESSVIATALGMTDAAVVVDDLSGRRCALAMGLRVIGTLGVVVGAHKRGQVPDVRAFLVQLRAHGCWLSDDLIEKTVRLAGQ